ncbi:MAG: hypothetical protein HQ475_09185 [SAR202 cluster bacterium]|nr:hypothetical protein [SAR202 cluster bacterium]
MLSYDYSDLETSLAPYFDLFHTAVTFGWNEWRRKYKDDASILTRRSRASIVRDHILSKAIALVADKPELRIVSYRGRDFIVIHDQVLVTFKKLDRKGRASNPATDQSTKINEQIPLSGMPLGAKYVQAGYILDVTQSDFQEMRLTYQCGTDVLWHLTLSDANVPAPRLEDAPQQPERVSRNIRPKIEKPSVIK